MNNKIVADRGTRPALNGRKPANTENARLKLQQKLVKRYRKTLESWGSDAAMWELVEDLTNLMMETPSAMALADEPLKVGG